MAHITPHKTIVQRFRINDVRCDWPLLFKGEQYQGTGSYRCGIKLLIEKTDPQYLEVEERIKQAAVEKWKDKATQTLKLARAKDNVSLRDGEMQKNAPEAYEGCAVLSANCPGGETEAECTKPQVFDANTNLVTDPGKSPIYRGCYVSASVEVYADNRFGDGVFAKLVGVQFRKDGDAFSGAPARSDDFEPASEGADADDMS